MVRDSVLANRVILLNGMSCAGKSAIAPEIKRLLWEQYKTPTVTIEIDDYWRQLEPSFNNSLERMATAMHTDIVRHFRAGKTVVVDHVFYSDVLYINFLKHLKDCPVFFVKLFCNDTVGKKRLLDRNSSENIKEHRPADILERDKRGPIHKNKTYDYEFDTSYSQVINAATAIVEHYLLLPTQHVGAQHDNIALMFTEIFGSRTTTPKTA